MESLDHHARLLHGHQHRAEADDAAAENELAAHFAANVAFAGRNDSERNDCEADDGEHSVAERTLVHGKTLLD
ncbi:MAG: hypothetical protein RL538_283 [Candidatus Parcubacteria bacterium]